MFLDYAYKEPRGAFFHVKLWQAFLLVNYSFVLAL